MKDRFFGFRHTDLQTLIATLAVLTFNNWLLALALNKSTLFSGAAVSELSLSGQPYASLFQILDIISGVLSIILAILLIHKKILTKNSPIFILIGFLGLANVVDAGFPIKCTINCKDSLGVTLSHIHTYTSVLITLALLVLPILGWIYAKAHNNQRLKFLSLLMAAFSTFSILFALIVFWVNHSFSAQGYGAVQEMQMFLFGFWFICFFTFMIHKNT